MNVFSERILHLLKQLYSVEQAEMTHQRVLDLLNTARIPKPQDGDYFSEQTITLITYGDSLLREGEAPLQTLHHFLRDYLKETLSTVHILPFYPYSSDDGFSVIDYHAVNPALGTWEDIRALSAGFRMMFDAVVNHMSAQSGWFKNFLAEKPGFERAFFTENPETDLRAVTRPRTSPLLTPFTRDDGRTVYVWTTFSADQVDLDFRDPETLLRILQVLLFYVEQGAEVLRLDAIAYLWKEAGTTCIHLPQTHAVIQLFRAALDIAAPHVILITETNVPHAENISYFGDGRLPEAQLVYNFTLPPLLFYTMLSGDARLLSDWINRLHVPVERATFFNFTASHDGIGVRPVEGILSPAQLQMLIQKVEQSGGRVSYKANPDGTQSPYELNITYLDAVVDSAAPVEEQARRFLAAQAVMLALAGVPAIYIHSLLGSRNDVDGMQRAGYNRAINREKLQVDRVISALNDPESFRSLIFPAYTRLIQTRIKSPAFHPLAPQRAVTFNDGAVLALERGSTESVLCLFNLSSAAQQVRTGLGTAVDLLTGQSCEDALTLAPYQVYWLKR